MLNGPYSESPEPNSLDVRNLRNLSHSKYSPQTSDDASPKRAAAAYQYILGADNSPAAVDADSLIDLVYAVRSQYRANGSFVLNSVTAGQVRKLKDSTGQYLWQTSLQGGQPDRLLGFPARIVEAFDDPNGGAFPVAFGDFRRAYMLVDRQQIAITVDPYTTPGYTKFYVRKRVGGIVSNNDSVKFLKLL